MEPIKATLCPECTECPEVEITEQGVTIGEDANTVRLLSVVTLSDVVGSANFDVLPGCASGVL